MLVKSIAPIAPNNTGKVFKEGTEFRLDFLNPECEKWMNLIFCKVETEDKSPAVVDSTEIRFLDTETMEELEFLNNLIKKIQRIGIILLDMGIIFEKEPFFFFPGETMETYHEMDAKERVQRHVLADLIKLAVLDVDCENSEILSVTTENATIFLNKLTPSGWKAYHTWEYYERFSIDDILNHIGESGGYI